MSEIKYKVFISYHHDDQKVASVPAFRKSIWHKQAKWNQHSMDQAIHRGL